ncbi:ABC transporter permease [Deinococcus sp. QL22]|uniref:ABC transporter permease n=1 Tax=Deinococcus sp. QL22 TaxID=2939437 RepID=UPI0020183BB7|nr:ABC transporter permease [Deinococcus sp. QL22]UQN08216.1 ABC transporter permease [Deinococcus sp. QL22]
MFAYFIRRVLQMIPSLLGISLIVFLLLRLSGDPVRLMLPEDASLEQVQSLRTALGLDQPLLVQYGKFLTQMVTGDFGESIRYTNQSVLQIVIERLPATLELSVAALFVAILISLPIGILAAIKRNSLADRLASTLAVLGRAMPSFWVGILLIMVFATQFQWLPVSGREGWTSIVLPAITLGISLAALLMRLLRSNLIEVLGLDYIRTARAKGLSPRTVVRRHALRNALLSYLTVLGLEMASLLGGAVVTEQVFAWPGVGLLAVQAINSRDMAVVQAVVIIASVIVMVTNLMVDMAYALVDPRIRYT